MLYPLNVPATQNESSPNILIGFETHSVVIYVDGRYLLV